MRRTEFLLLAALLPAAIGSVSEFQSLTEVARKEAERRQKLEEKGIHEKKIEGTDLSKLAPNGSISTSSPAPGSPAVKVPAAKAGAGESLRSFQTRLQKLDRDIAQAEAKLKVLKARADAERWAPLKSTKGSRSSGSSSGQADLRWQILDEEGKLDLLRKERSDTFQAGRKAGYLPGELEGRGIVR